MSVAWWIISGVVLIFFLQAFELLTSKRPQKLVFKEQVNSNFTLCAFIAGTVLFLFFVCSLGSLSTVVHYKVYQGLEPSTIAWIQITAKVLPIVSIFLVLLFFVWFIRKPQGFPSRYCIWKYSPEEIEYKKIQAELLKERNRKRLNPKLFKFLYSEKKTKKDLKYPRLYKFIFGEQKDK